MASKAKPTGARRNSTQAKKPTTIDLDAKEVAKDVKAEATTAASKTQNFGRPEKSELGTSEKTPDTKTDHTKTATPEKSTSPKGASSSVPKTETKKPEAKKAEAKPASPAPKETTSATPKPEKSSGSFFGKLTSAFMGGVAALVGFGAIGLWEGARELPIIGNFYGGSQSSTKDTSQFDALKAEIEALKQTTASPSVDLAPINQKLSSLETTVSEISGASTGSDALTAKITNLEEGFAAVNNSLAEITASAADGSNTSPVALSTAISALDKRLETLEADLATVSSSVSKNPTLDALSGSINTLETQVSGVTTAVASLKQAADANSKTISGLTAQSETLNDTVASVKASEKVAKSVAVNALATALENDDPLSLPISSIKALIGETPETKRLEAINTAGIASRKELVTNLDALINTVQNPNAPSKDGSITERFWANAQNMVSFRTSGPQEGDTPLAILSRVKAHIEADNLSQAKAEWETLPADVRENGASWLAQLNGRIEAFGLQNALNQKLTAEAG